MPRKSVPGHYTFKEVCGQRIHAIQQTHEYSDGQGPQKKGSSQASMET